MKPTPNGPRPAATTTQNDQHGNSRAVNRPISDPATVPAGGQGKKSKGNGKDRRVPTGSLQLPPRSGNPSQGTDRGRAPVKRARTQLAGKHGLMLPLFTNVKCYSECSLFLNQKLKKPTHTESFLSIDILHIAKKVHASYEYSLMNFDKPSPPL